MVVQVQIWWVTTGADESPHDCSPAAQPDDEPADGAACWAGAAYDAATGAAVVAAGAAHWFCCGAYACWAPWLAGMLSHPRLPLQSTGLTHSNTLEK